MGFICHSAVEVQKKRKAADALLQTA